MESKCRPESQNAWIPVLVLTVNCFITPVTRAFCVVVFDKGHGLLHTEVSVHCGVYGHSTGAQSLNILSNTEVRYARLFQILSTLLF